MALSLESTALVYLAVSAFFFSIMGSFMKLASDDVPSTQLVFYRAFFQGCIVIVGMAVIREGTESSLSSDSSEDRRRMIFVPLGNRRQRCIVIGRGIAGGFGFCCYFFSIKSLPIGDAITLFSLYPIVTLFLARVFLGEMIRCLNLFAALVSLIGAILIAGPSFLFTKTHNDSPKNHHLGYIAALVGSVAGAVVLVLTRQAGKQNVHAFQLIFSWSIFSIALSLLFGQTIGEELEEKWHYPHSRQIWVYIIGMCIFGSAAHTLMNYAARIAPAGSGAIARSSDIMWSYMWEVIIFHQVPGWNAVFGGLMILVSLATLAVARVSDEMSQTSDEGSESLVGSKEESLPMLSVDEHQESNAKCTPETSIQHHENNYSSI
eukprot:CAMPEP_0204637020 /NCGR_PEP_ID=MMETSP0717-20131115/35392_1 /ASSEMBLY_ACC=CAM_ASM_000666 /TAXON_ID=230516 /ORGANISM="Chaetoceros curvisetus" /LENGTH=375 /DNA_ID=CAMNT_0051656269 /DNA_START=22 /DNA_END=1149 /DNA_ORIENTATION=-